MKPKKPSLPKKKQITPKAVAGNDEYGVASYNGVPYTWRKAPRSLGDRGQIHFLPRHLR